MSKFLSCRSTLAACTVVLALSLAACETIGEVVGPIAEAVGGTAQLTIWTTDPSPSPIEVVVNGVVVGRLTAYRTSPPACGAANSAGVITITRSPGTYSLSARETESDGVWPRSDLQLTAGGCLLFTLNP